MFIGWGEIHPVRSMHDTVGWAPTDYNLYEPRVSANSPLAEHQAFNSKEHLQFAISKRHIEKNREYVVTDSNKQKLRVKCKDPDCEWRLYAKSIGNAWAIMKCLYKYICRATVARVDYAQLTAKMIADVIREDIEKDHSITVKQVRKLVKKVYPGVNLKYNKLWRGREISIAYIYGSWSGSYALLHRLLNVIISLNPGSKAQLLSDPLIQSGVRQFKCAAWAFAPCIQAFRYLHPVISIDVSFLRGRYEGKIPCCCWILC
jgi:hypothetical protein